MTDRVRNALPAVGSPAPDFTLPSTSGADVILSSLHKFFSNRAYVLVGPDGVVRWAFAEDTPSTRRENRELLAQLEKHQRFV